MNQEERSQRCREQVLEAALQLFSSQGYRGTSVRDIAERSGVSTGAVYHQFPDKESLFRTLLDEYWEAIESPDLPLNRALAEGAFPRDLERLGAAARETVERYRRHIALVYVDVVEFEGRHIRKFYAEMAQRFRSFMAQHPVAEPVDSGLRPGVSPVTSVMLASRFFLNFFAVELLFGVPEHFGKPPDQVVREVADILAHGMLAGPKAGEGTAGRD